MVSEPFSDGLERLCHFGCYDHRPAIVNRSGNHIDDGLGFPGSRRASQDKGVSFARSGYGSSLGAVELSGGLKRLCLSWN
ncbi:hypothetical protein GCM10019059_36170 [Camelimonas fluminis]|nr:hypothetical protein GCM10019059_36170 [Camelimonas fluminis]